MASDIITVYPGHFMLPLLINKDINVDKAVVETKLQDLDHFRQIKAGRPEELAILNVKGLLTLRLQRYKESLRHFHDVLGKDPDNLNALANLQYVMEKLFRLAEAKRFKDTCTRLLRPSVNLDVESDPPAEIPKKQRCLIARCLAEQAYAHTFDIHTDNVKGERYKQSIELYQKALNLAGDDVERIEQVDWKFCIAINEHRLFKYLPYYNQPDSHDVEDHSVLIARNLFFELTHGGLGVDEEIQWDSWCQLGDIFRTMKVRKKITEGYSFPEMKKYQRSPELCMQKAMEISPNNARLLERYANFLYSLEKNRKKALELLEKSILLGSCAFNFKAFSTRAMINLKFIKSHSRQDSPRVKEILQSAKSDLKKAVSLHVTPWDLTQLGEVYYLLAKHHTKQDSEVKLLFQKALVCFTKSVDCPDGRNRSDVHFMRGRCLFDLGEKRAAIGCFKQAIDCEPASNKYTRNFKELFRVYLTILQEENPPKDMSIVAETAYSLKKALEKYGEYDMREHFISTFKSEYREELKLLEKYSERFTELTVLSSLLEESLWRRAPFSPRRATAPSWGHGRRPPVATALSGVDIKESEYVPHALKVVAGADADKGIKTKKAEVGRREAGDQERSVASEGVSGNISEQSEHVPHAVTVDSIARLMEEVGMDEAEGKAMDVAAEGAERNISSSLEQQPIKEAPKEARVSNFKYDFLVVYPKCERDWVSYDLLNELEAIRGLKGCTRDRDGLAGELKIKSEINLMTESASILLVVNNNFHRECEDLMHYALKLRKDKECSRVVIPILRDDAPIPDEIDMILIPFDATGAVNWDKLAFCIEQQI